jgi:hypothetical protein
MWHGSCFVFTAASRRALTRQKGHDIMPRLIDRIEIHTNRHGSARAASLYRAWLLRWHRSQPDRANVSVSKSRVWLGSERYWRLDVRAD